MTYEEELDDKIEEWHNGNSGLDLHEYLGLTYDEYCEFFTKPSEFFSSMSEIWEEGYEAGDDFYDVQGFGYDPPNNPYKISGQVSKKAEVWYEGFEDGMESRCNAKYVSNPYDN